MSKAAQVDEATELVKLYRERYGKEPDEHAFFLTKFLKDVFLVVAFLFYSQTVQRISIRFLYFPN